MATSTTDIRRRLEEERRRQRQQTTRPNPQAQARPARESARVQEAGERTQGTAERVRQGATNLRDRVGSAAQRGRDAVTSRAANAPSLARRATQAGGRLVRNVARFGLAPAVIADVGTDVIRGGFEGLERGAGFARGAADRLSGLTTPEAQATATPLDRAAGAVRRIGRGFTEPGARTLAGLRGEDLPARGTPERVSQGESETPPVDEELETAADQLANLRTRPNPRSLPRGTGVIANERTGDVTTIDTRGQGATEGGTREPGQDRERFDLRGFLNRANREGTLNAGTAGIAAGVLNLTRSRNQQEFDNRLALEDARTRRLAALGAGRGRAGDGAAELTQQLSEDLVSDDPELRDQALARAVNEGAAGNQEAARLSRVTVANRVRDEANPGLIRTLLPRLFGGAERGPIDAIASFFDGDPTVNIAGAFEGFEIVGDELRREGQDLVNLNDLGSPALVQALRTFVSLDNPERQV